MPFRADIWDRAEHLASLHKALTLGVSMLVTPLP